MQSFPDFLADIIDAADDDDARRLCSERMQAAVPETASARAARERREGAERARRYRERRVGRDAEREQALAAREAEVARREAELAVVEHDTVIVEALRAVLVEAGWHGRLRTQEDLQAAKIGLHPVFARAIRSLIRDVGMDQPAAIRLINDRLLRRGVTAA